MIELSTINPLALPSLPLKMRSQLPKVPAVYFVIAEDNQIIYIGQSVNLAQRWIHHHRRAEFADTAKAQIAWLEVSDTNSRVSLESSLIAHFQPSLNWKRQPLCRGIYQDGNPLKAADAFDLTLKTFKLKASEIASKSGLKPSVISVFRNHHINVGCQTFMKMLKAIPHPAQVYFVHLVTGISLEECAEGLQKWQ